MVPPSFINPYSLNPVAGEPKAVDLWIRHGFAANAVKGFASPSDP